MIGVAFLFALTMALDKVAMQHAAITAHALFQASFITVTLTAVILLPATSGRVSKFGPRPGDTDFIEIEETSRVEDNTQYREYIGGRVVTLRFER